MKQDLFIECNAIDMKLIVNNQNQRKKIKYQYMKKMITTNTCVLDARKNSLKNLPYLNMYVKNVAKVVSRKSNNTSVLLVKRFSAS